MSMCRWRGVAERSCCCPRFGTGCIPRFTSLTTGGIDLQGVGLVLVHGLQTSTRSAAPAVASSAAVARLASRPAGPISSAALEA